MKGHEIERMYGWSKAEEADHPTTPRYVCECGMPLAMTKRRAVSVQKAHLICREFAG